MTQPMGNAILYYTYIYRKKNKTTNARVCFSFYFVFCHSSTCPFFFVFVFRFLVRFFFFSVILGVCARPRCTVSSKSAYDSPRHVQCIVYNVRATLTRFLPTLHRSVNITKISLCLLHSFDDRLLFQSFPKQVKLFRKMLLFGISFVCIWRPFVLTTMAEPKSPSEFVPSCPY